MACAANRADKDICHTVDEIGDDHDIDAHCQSHQHIDKEEDDTGGTAHSGEGKAAGKTADNDYISGIEQELQHISGDQRQCEDDQLICQ